MKKPQQPRINARVADLGSLVDKLNTWAKAPGAAAHSQALRLALRQYQQSVKSGRYTPIERSFCMRTPAGKAAPPAIPGSFESYFGDSE